MKNNFIVNHIIFEYDKIEHEIKQDSKKNENYAAMVSKELYGLDFLNEAEKWESDNYEDDYLFDE